MKQTVEFFKMESNSIGIKQLLVYITLAYIITLLIRLIAYSQFSEIPQYLYNGNIVPLWTPDAGLYGFYAKQLLSGISYPFVAEYMPGYLLYALHQVTGYSIDALLLFLPAFIASLIVVPILLIANFYKIPNIGLLAAIIGAISTNYYYRTPLGYYDTDILNVTLPLLGIAFIIALIEKQKFIYSLLGSLALSLFALWYHVASPINGAIIAFFVLYIVLFDRKNTLLYRALFVLFMALLPISILYKVIFTPLVYGVFYFIDRVKWIDYRYYLGVIVAVFIVVFIFADSSKYTKRVNDYLSTNENIEVKAGETSLFFVSDLAMVTEAAKVNYTQFLQRTSGLTILLVLSILGYIALLIRYRSFWVTLPMILFTFGALWGGVRFTIYGITLLSFGLIFALFVIRNIFINYVEYSKATSNAIIALFVFFIGYYSVTNVVKFNRLENSVVFSTNDDLQKLEAFKNQLSTKQNFMINWWDYSWPLWYYTGVQTLIDNGKHQQDNFIVSKILLSDNQNFVQNASIFFSEMFYKGKRGGYPKVMDYFASTYGMEQLSQFNQSDIALPKRKRDLYILLHNNMYRGLSIIESMSNIDYYAGRKLTSNIFASDIMIKTDKATKQLVTPNGYINVIKGMLKYQNKTYNIASLAVKRDGKLIFKKQYDDNESSMQIIIEDELILYLNKRMLNSFLIQALFFNNFDREKFESIVANKNFMILKVK
ncbi:MAG: hypothetical protein JXQ76_02950 [Campylobacterales bacterium]|nr:hypothetical protein [Campylobacterales bacterium]